MTDSAGAAPVGARQQQDLEKGDTRMDTTGKGTDSRTAMDKPAGSAHSPMPWHQGPHYRFEIWSREGRVAEAVAFTPRGDIDAEFIVRACNSHADLLAALKAIVAALQADAPGTPLNNHKYDALGMQAHKAISKAEGR